MVWCGFLRHRLVAIVTEASPGPCADKAVVVLTGNADFINKSPGDTENAFPWPPTESFVLLSHRM